MGVEITMILRFDGFAIRRQKMSKPITGDLQSPVIGLAHLL